ncbi:MAG: MarR family transcriptional regulator [SAR324 cluster bacterium]|nr:MarR family transcriptional regulator [SAR324 cluster bacterium]
MIKGDKNSKSSIIPNERYDLQILQDLRRIMRAVDLYSRQLVKKYSITTPQLVCLLTIVEHNSITVTALANEIHLSSSTVVGVLDRIEDKGLITRKRDKKDRRVVKVSPTTKGKDYAKSAPSPLQDKLLNSLSSISSLEQAAISLSLSKIVELMEAEEIDASPLLAAGQIDSTVLL